MWHDTILYDMTWYDPIIQMHICSFHQHEVRRRLAQRQEARPWWGALQRRRKIFGKSLFSNEYRDFEGLGCHWYLDMGFRWFPGLRPGSQTDHPLYPSFHKVVWICLPEIHWHPLSWNFLFRLKCYILGCVDSGTIFDRDLAVFSFCVFSMTRYALITLILEGLSPRLKLPELEHHFWPLTSMQTRLHSPQINLPTSRRVEVGSWEVQTRHAEATKREESLERALFVGRMALNTEQLGLDRRGRTHPDLHRWLMSCWDWNGKIKCFLLQKSVVIAVNASCFP